MNSLNGKLALITGAASGIGLATARLFAQHGCDLALVDIAANIHDVGKNIQEEFSNAIVTSHVVDVANSEQVNALFAEIKNKHPKHSAANVIVNSAGIARSSPITEMSEAEFDQVVDISLKGTFLITQGAARALIANFDSFKAENETQSYASIINLASQASKRGAAGASHYSAAKAGIEGFTRSMAKELGDYKIRCNAILPYFIETSMIDFLDANKRALYSSLVPLKRLGKAEEVAQLALFLATDASSYISGNSIDIAGGY
jgi:NAD(P)-dependent dehydrogenase (short-subunit alcohol dehydrogenase family)